MLGKRGPPPEKLAELFRLKYLQGDSDRENLAEKLGISLTSVYKYERRLEEKLVQKLGHVSRDRLSLICPSCLEAQVYTDPENGECVCRSCGLVIEQEADMVQTLPFDTTYALTSNMSFGKSLGGTLPRQQLFKVLAKAPAGTLDLPIRSTQIQVISSAVDPPLVKKMLEYGSRMLKDLGLDRDTDECHLFADQYGRLLRKIAGFIQVSRVDVQPHLVVRAALCYLLRGNPKKAKEASRKYPFDSKYYNMVAQVTELFNNTLPRKASDRQ